MSWGGLSQHSNSDNHNGTRSRTDSRKAKSVYVGDHGHVLNIFLRDRSTRRWVVGAAAVVIAAVLVGFVTLGRDGAALSTNSAGPSAAVNAGELESRFDGKDQRGLRSSDSRCADPPDSISVPASQPPIQGPDGAQVGNIQLRASSSLACPTVVWARVLWNNDPAATYQIPPSWTLHVVSHRPDANDMHDETEPASDSKIPYALSAMMSSARGCVYVEGYFTSGDKKTAPAVTSCVTVGQFR